MAMCRSSTSNVSGRPSPGTSAIFPTFTKRTVPSVTTRSSILPRSLLVLRVPTLDAVDPHLERLQGEERAFEAHRPKLDAEHLEDVLASQPLHFLQSLPLDLLGEHRSGRSANRAADAREAHVFDGTVLDAEIHADLVATERIGILGADVRRLQGAEVAGVLAVVEDILPIEVVEAH